MKVTFCDKCRLPAEKYTESGIEKVVSLVPDIPVMLEENLATTCIELCFNCLDEFTTWLKEKPTGK